MTSKRWVGVVVAAVVVSVSATLFAGRVFDDEATVAGALSATLRSTVLGEEREYFVHLPAGYEEDTSTRYPVLYVLDGASQSGNTAESAGLLARVGTIPPLIVVGISSRDGDTRNRDYTPPEMRLDTDTAASDVSARGAADRFLTFLQSELIDRIERDYRTARPRMLAGWSRGGLFVVYSALVAPSLFDARFAHSPALWRENDQIVTRLEEALAAEQPPSGWLYLSLGDQENEKMTASFRHAVDVLERAAPAALRWRADLTAGGRHDSNPRLATPVGLCAMFRVDQPCRGSGIRPLVQEPLAATSISIRR
jgi:predicted alpha/beta superfamily hydrolase